MVEEQFNLDSISEQVYKDNVKKLLKSFKAITRQIPGYNLDNFCRVYYNYYQYVYVLQKEYGLDDCTWAKDRIKKGVPDLGGENDRAIFMKTNNKFHDLDAALALFQAKPLVKEFKPIIEDLLFLLKQCSQKGVNLQEIADLEKQLITMK